jgi:hypothetical protein
MPREWGLTNPDNLRRLERFSQRPFAAPYNEEEDKASLLPQNAPEVIC